MDALSYLSRRCASTIETSQHTLSKFTDSLASDPLYAMQWSDSAFTAVADLHVAQRVLAFIEKGMAAEDIKLELTERVTRMATSPSQSTSPSANVSFQRELAAWGRVLQDLKFL